MKLLRKIIRIIVIIAVIIGVIYVAMHLSEIIAMLPLDKLKVFFGNMFSYIVRVFKNIIEWFREILT